MSQTPNNSNAQNTSSEFDRSIPGGAGGVVCGGLNGSQGPVNNNSPRSSPGSNFNYSGFGRNIDTEGMDPLTSDILLNPKFQAITDKMLLDEVSRYVNENVDATLKLKTDLYVDDFVRQNLKRVIQGLALRNILPGTEPCVCSASSRGLVPQPNTTYNSGGRAMTSNNGGNTVNGSQAGCCASGRPSPQQTCQQQTMSEIAGEKQKYSGFSFNSSLSTPPNTMYDEQSVPFSAYGTS